MGSKFNAFAVSLDIKRTAAAASLIPEAFPAVTVPPVLKAVASLPIFSKEVSMGLSSVSKRIGSPFFCGITTGMISSLKIPFLMAALAL